MHIKFPFSLLALTAATLLCLAAPNALRADDGESLADKARRLHADAIVIDSHSDTPLRMRGGWDFMERHNSGHMDYPRIREGGLDAVFLIVYMGKQKEAEPGIAVKKACALFDRIHSLIDANADRLELALTAADVRRAADQDRTAVLIGVEGGHIIDNDLAALRTYYRLGARYMTLTHTFHHDWADSSGYGRPMEPGQGGLTDFGRDVVREMNRLGMIVDVSHVSDETFHDTIETSSAPIMASHSGCRSVCDHPRNLTDDMIRALADRGGVLQIVFFPGYLDPEFEAKADRARRLRANREEEIRSNFKNDPGEIERRLAELKKTRFLEPTPISMVIDHIEHVIDLVGPDHVGLGADWDGVPFMCEGVEDCSQVGNITLELLKRGHDEETIRKVLGGNLLRLMEEVASAAGRTRGK